jgi:hypothetical protein
MTKTSYNDVMAVRNPGIDADGLEMSVSLVRPDDFEVEDVEGGIVYRASKKYQVMIKRIYHGTWNILIIVCSLFVDLSQIMRLTGPIGLKCFI